MVATPRTPVSLAGDERIPEINDAIRQTLDRFGPADFEYVDLPRPMRTMMEELGLPVDFPFPVHRIGTNWALIRVPAKRWTRLRSQFTRAELYRPGGEDPRFHLFPLSRDARSLTTLAIYPGMDGYCPGTIIINPRGDKPREEEDPVALRLSEMRDADLTIMMHEAAAHMMRLNRD